MVWVEMFNGGSHGGGEWEFTKCLWSPAYKSGGTKAKWPYWQSILSVRDGDVILHLKGTNHAEFVGHSVAVGDGFKTTIRPPEPGKEYEYADAFYRVNLGSYQPFKSTIELTNLFSKKTDQLKNYYNKNKKLEKKRLLFYVIQNSVLRRQNGAYLSEIDNELYNILFTNKGNRNSLREVDSNTRTGEGRRSLKTRQGQKDFSDNVKDNFGYKCCFPGCNVKDSTFLVGAHIVRWADIPEYRGETSNGLCLCLMHDKAFEVGLFTLDHHLRVSVNKERMESSHFLFANLLSANGKRIKESILPIDINCLKLHWERIVYRP